MPYRPPPAAASPQVRLDDPAFLLELALAANKTLDPSAECRVFIDTLRERAGVDGGLWFRAVGVFQPVCGSGAFGSAPQLSPDHPLARATERGEVFLAPLPDARFEGLADAASGVAAACRVGQDGLMALHASEGISLGAEEVEALRPVMEQLAATHHMMQAVSRDSREQKELEAQLREAKSRADSSVQAKERFLATMSHEIRTPLNAVLGLSHLLGETALAEEQTEYVQGIAAAADALLSLVNDVLDFARLGAEKLTFEAIPFQPADLLHDLVLVLRPRAEAKGIELHLALDPAVPDELIGDPHRLRQILINLVSNAVKFTHEGGVTVHVMPVAGGTDGSIVLQFEVVDTGIGISPDQHERIFESFTQARSDDARNEGGSGLGLAIVKELVEGQQGTVSVASEEGSGSRFAVSLPFAPSAARAPEPKPEGYADLRGLHVLLAEDIAANQFVATRMLERWGVAVTVVENGREAIEQVVSYPEKFDLVLMDLQMPEMDGITATRTIRDTLGLPRERLPILALTASVLAQQRDEVLAAGFDEFILKPFDPVYLSHRIAFLTGRIEEADRQPVNRAALERYALGDPSFVRELMALFYREVPSKVGMLAEAAEAGAWEEVWTLAHQAKSQAAYVGAERLAASLAEVERRARGARPEDAVPEARRAAALCQAVENDLKKLSQQEATEHA
ncbi:MAG: ATP-binding protein [Bacteroidota bacterium]